MLEAGRRSLCSFSSNNTFPVSSEATLIPIIAGASCGLRSTSVIRACKSATDAVDDEVLAPAGAGVGLGEATGLGVGIGVGLGAGAVVVARRSRCGACGACGAAHPAGTDE